MAEESPKESFDWRPIAAAGLGGLLTLVGVFLTRWSAEKQERERIAADLKRHEGQMTHEAGLEREKIAAQSKLESERLAHQANLEKQKLAADSALARDVATMEARLGYTDKLLDLRLRQLEQFIAPLRALLKQSQGVTQKLQLQLAEDSENYQWVDVAVEGKTLRGLNVKVEGQSYDFRLLDRLPALKNDPGCGPLIAEIIRIGNQITDLISKNAGLALSELSEPNRTIPEPADPGAPAAEPAPTLPDTLGKYLAHFAILKRIYEDQRTEPYPPGKHKIGYYPRELNDLVETEYRLLLKDLKPYFETSAAVLADLKHRADLKRRAEATNIMTQP